MRKEFPSAIALCFRLERNLKNFQPKSLDSIVRGRGVDSTCNLILAFGVREQTETDMQSSFRIMNEEKTYQLARSEHTPNQRENERRYHAMAVT
jgi:hypothetical protein